MAKAYWVSCYRAVNDPDKLAAYAKMAGPIIQAKGGRFLARALADEVYEAGVKERLVIIEFDSLALAVSAHDSPEYQEAIAVLDDGAVRDLRIVSGVA